MATGVSTTANSADSLPYKPSTGAGNVAKHRVRQAAEINHTQAKRALLP